MVDAVFYDKMIVVARVECALIYWKSVAWVMRGSVWPLLSILTLSDIQGYIVNLRHKFRVFPQNAKPRG